MDTARLTLLASLMVLISGTLWGFYWLPVREIAALGLGGAWGSLAIVTAGVAALAPFAWRGRAALYAADLWGVLSIALGGLAFMLYSISFLYGQVAVVVILFFLTPVWSTLLGRIFLGWPITRMRVLVLVFGLAGLAVMLGAEGLLPVPRSLGEWLGLASGFCWAVASVGIRVRRTPPPVQGAFVFALGACLSGAVLAPLLGPLPRIDAISAPVQLSFWVLTTGGFWWAFFIAGLMWATPKLDPARTGILLMIEVPVAAVSAALIIGEHLSIAEWIGGGLVVTAGLIEVWPTRAKPPKVKI